ncbi:hypothetical protein Scep_004740 [Stephania cephalantha]|uniref:Uncharacterized protein n=1 Tax=Stephania cephalantha TaxID=152367 RepID=A0AAP0KT00_9MAGN
MANQLDQVTKKKMQDHVRVHGWSLEGVLEMGKLGCNSQIDNRSECSYFLATGKACEHESGHDVSEFRGGDRYDNIGASGPKLLLYLRTYVTELYVQCTSLARFRLDVSETFT